MPQGSIQWQGTQRRAYAPGANWNVQVVRSKTTTQCLWHACKALGLGLLLMLLGACMATIGYYADQLSVAQEIRGNHTVRVKNESRGIHLNNLSYAGPIIMGVGGFIVVAACVMTFEARDSAAKVVPARFRFNQTSTLKKSQRNRKSTSSQTSKWDQQLGLFRVNRSPSPSLRDQSSRRQLTAELIKFSKNLEDKGVTNTLKKSPSAPTLVEKKSPSRRRSPKYGEGCALLNPELLKRHAVSVDNPGYSPHQISRENLELQKLNGSQASMAMDLHLPNKGAITLKIKDRSDTARRHQLVRQTKLEDAEDLEDAKRTAALNRSYSPKPPGTATHSFRYPDDFVPRKRNSVDLRILGELTTREMAPTKTSPRDFRKVSSPNFRKMSLDRIGGERRHEKLSRKSSLMEFRRSPDFRRSDYRKYSIERFTADCAKYLGSSDPEGKSKTSSGENLQRKPARGHPRLYHSRSDDRRRSFDRYRGDSQSSRHSLNTQVVIEDRGGSADNYELKYFTATASLDTEESRADVSDCESHVTHDYEDGVINSSVLSDGLPEADTLLEEPELENLPENLQEENASDYLDKTTVSARDSSHYAKQETLSPVDDIYETIVDVEEEETDDRQIDEIKEETSEDNPSEDKSKKCDTVIDISQE